MKQQKPKNNSKKKPDDLEAAKNCYTQTTGKQFLSTNTNSNWFKNTGEPGSNSSRVSYIPFTQILLGKM